MQKMQSWLEVSLAVNGELAEAVADVLARYAPNGVVTEQGVAFMNEEDEGTGVGPVTVRAYLPVDAQLADTRRKLEEALYYLGRIQPLPAPAYREIADQNWMEAWKGHYRPIPIGKWLIIVPTWLDSPGPERIPIRIDPGMAFGTGTHPTTQLCLGLIEEYFREGRTRTTNHKPPSVIRAPSSVIDIGCGSGILSIAALKLGAGSALGLDIDPESIRNARDNAEVNGIGEEFITAQGSVQEALEGKYPIRRGSLVVANILAPVIERLFGSGLADLVEPGGRLILSGILQAQARSVMDSAEAHGLVLAERKELGDWVALAYSNSSSNPDTPI
jgi:ribosomal protein L11 methyltransferase